MAMVSSAPSQQRPQQQSRQHMRSNRPGRSSSGSNSYPRRPSSGCLLRAPADTAPATAAAAATGQRALRSHSPTESTPQPQPRQPLQPLQPGAASAGKAAKDADLGRSRPSARTGELGEGAAEDYYGAGAGYGIADAYAADTVGDEAYYQANGEGY